MTLLQESPCTIDDLSLNAQGPSVARGCRQGAQTLGFSRSGCQISAKPYLDLTPCRSRAIPLLDFASHCECSHFSTKRGRTATSLAVIPSFGGDKSRQLLSRALCDGADFQLLIVRLLALQSYVCVAMLQTMAGSCRCHFSLYCIVTWILSHVPCCLQVFVVIEFQNIAAGRCRVSN